MISKNREGLAWLEYAQLQPYPQVAHGIFLRDCGDFSDLYVREKAAVLLGVEKMAQHRQVHGDGVQVVKEAQVGECDGLITREVGLGLPIYHADCQAVLFFDPTTNTVANVHCGWRGNVLNIFAKAIEKMGSSPEDLLVCIGPSLGPEHGEFVNHERELPEEFLPFRRGKNHFDFWKISQWQLESLGVRKEAIECANICTYADKERFYSYRREKDRARHMTLIALIP